MFRAFFGALTLLAIAIPRPAAAAHLCTIVIEATNGKVLLEDGDCRTRVTPASTFKIPLAVIGFDSGFLRDAHNPVLAYKEGYVDWGGDNWKQPTDPTRWLKYSVVWYSQQIAHALGEPRLAEYAQKFGFGNADFSGDPGKNNGLDRAWIGSSLKISPFEQTSFLRKLVARELPVSEHAMTKATEIVEVSSATGGWEVHGKTGTAYPRKPDGTPDEAHGYGWYVGWAIKDGRTLIFAQLNQDDRKETTPGGLRVRAELLESWPKLAADALRQSN